MKRIMLSQSNIFLVFLMCIFGVILVSHIKSVQADITSQNLAQRYKQRQAEVQQAEELYNILLLENEQLNQRKNEIIADLLNQQGYESLLADLNRVKILAGMTEVKGPGIILTLDDKPDLTLADPSEAIIHDMDIQQALNLFRSLGAAAISVNGLRITNSSYVSCVGSTILCNQQRMTPPYVIAVLGDPDTLTAGYKENQYFSLRQSPINGIQIKIEQKEEVIIPPFAEADNFGKYIDLLEVGAP